MKFTFTATVLYLFFSGTSFSQNTAVAIGQWKSYLSYNGTVSIADAGDKIFCANGSSVFSYNKTDNSYERLSKTTGLSDIGATYIFYGKEQNTLVIPYLNSNVDFIINNTIVNFPYIKTSTLVGDKNIYGAAFKGDTIIISSGFGIVLYDIIKKESPASYYFTSDAGSYMRVNASSVFDNYIFAATENGIYKGDLDNPLLENFSNWQKLSGSSGLPEGEAKYITIFNNQIYTVVNDSSIYVYDGTEWNLFLYEQPWMIAHLDASNNTLTVTEIAGNIIDPDSNRIFFIDTAGATTVVQDEINLHEPRQTIIDDAGIIWIADPYKGLVKLSNGIFQYYIPNGPASSKVFDLEYYDNTLWVAPGEINGAWNYTFNTDGFFDMNYGYWNNINKYNYPQLDTILDYITTTVDARTGKAYFGSYGGGLAEYDKSTGQLNIYNQTNSALQVVPADITGSCRIAGLQVDVNGNLWVSNLGAPLPLVVKKADGTWKAFDCNLPADATNQTAQIAIDDFDQKWIQIPRGTGILVYNHGATIDDVSDDKTRVLGIGAGNGNLPVSYVNCLVKDKNNSIWVGTNEGVTIFYNPGEIFSEGTAGDASQPLVNLGGYNEYLLSKEIVNCIAVDGANRKWIGTNSGVFLISEDGTQQLVYFNQDNSPLLSNIILSITIDGVNGDVYFGTSKGIVSYRYTSTEGMAQNTDVKVFPDPVRENYTGLIAISGLVNNAKVKITDVSGRLIYETTALGGQAVWDGKGYEGNRAKTGVYLVYSSADDGSEKFVTKFLIVN